MTTPAPTPKRRSWPRRLAWLAALFLVLLAAVYFTVTSGAFFKAVVVPKIARAMNADVAVADASIHPFSAVTLKSLTVRTTGAEPAVSIDEVRLRYSLSAILGGTLQVDEVALVHPQIRVIQNADGTSNLDALTRGGPKDTASRSPSPGPGPAGSGSQTPPKIAIARIAMENGQVRVTQAVSNGPPVEIELGNLNFALTDLRNGQTAHLKFDGAGLVRSGPTSSNNTAKAGVTIDLNFGLTPDLNLSFAKGAVIAKVDSATGVFEPVGAFRSVIDIDITPTEFKRVAWQAFNGARPIAEMTMAGQFDFGKKEGALDFTLGKLNFADWQSFAPGLNAVGTVAAKGHLAARDAGRQMAFDWQATADGIGATIGSNRVSELGVALATRGTITNFGQVHLDRSELTVSHQTQPAAHLTAGGDVTANPRSASVSVSGDFDLARLTRILPQPSVQLASGDFRLVDVRVQQQGERQSVTGHMVLTNLTGRVSSLVLQGMALGADYDVAVANGNVVELKNLAVQLAETARTKANQFQLAGRIDSSRTNALEGELKLSAETLDVTPYYDLLAGPSKSGSPEAKPTTPTTTPPSGSTNAPIEPDPVHLPVKQLVVAAQIGLLWLREVEAAQVQATIKVEESKVTVRPFSLVMNGAPLTSEVDLDLSVTGWRYKIQAKADGLPIAPLADSFAPDYRGRARGELWTNLKVDGAGVTGPSLRKNLLGNIGLSFTNADIQIVGPRLKGFLAPISAALNAPGLLSSPLNWIGFGASMGSGKIDLSQIALVSPAFAAATHGELTLGNTLRETRLGNWPMALQLERSLADRLKLAPRDTPTNAALVSLPQFVTVAGTANEPTPKLDLKALAGAALLKYADKIPGLDERTGGLLKGAAGLLSGKAATGTNAAPGSTSPATNSPAGELLDLFKRPRRP